MSSFRKGQRLKLSDLKENVDYHLENSIPEGRCLIHVKMTDFCAKLVENLIDSNKGAFFSLWFEDSGGTMAIPVNDGEMRKFQFKTAHLQVREAQNTLECVHQSLDQQAQQNLSSWGPMVHRVTVQGTEEVYESTRTKMKQAEKQRKEPRAQEIKLPSKGQSKAKKILMASESVGQTSRKPSRPVQPKPPSSKAANKPSRSAHSLKDRVIHILALKPMKRHDLVTRLKKETKRSETSLTNLESILSEVSELSQNTCKLRPHCYANLQVETWPFYSDAERQMLKRRVPTNADSAVPAKRPLTSADEETPSKKARLTVPTPPLPSTVAPTPHHTVMPTPPHIVTPTPPTTVVHPTPIQSVNPTPNIAATQQSMPQITDQSLGGPQLGGHQSMPQLGGHQSLGGQQSQLVEQSVGKQSSGKKKKDKKKKKQKTKENSESRSDPSSTSNTPDYSSQFPPITSSYQRASYKRLFSSEYTDYLSLKESIDKVSVQYQKECTALSDRLQSLDKNSEEAKKVKSEIRAKYNELQSNTQYTADKKRFEELHHKLEHIKRMVIHYDSQS